MAVILNNNKNEDPNKEQPSGQTLQTVGTATPAGQSPSGTPTANSMANNLAQQQRQGSGRFTNLQKYIQANKAGGQRIAQQVGSNFNKQYEKEATQAKDYYSKLGTSIGEANKIVGQEGTGQGFQQQLQGIGQQIGGQQIGAMDSDAFKNWQTALSEKNFVGPGENRVGIVKPPPPIVKDGVTYNYNVDKSYGPTSGQIYYSDPFGRRYTPDELGMGVRKESITKIPSTPEEIEAQRQEQYKQYQQEMLANRGQADLSAIEAFTSDPNKFRDFQNIQAGRGINENLLALQQQRALSEAGQAADLARQTQAGLGSEAGRFEMLRKTFGKTPGYTTGQQRLDQVLFGQGGGLAGLQGDVTQKARSAVEQGNLAARAGQKVSEITQAERGLMTDINAQAKANEQAYMDMLSSYIDPTNVQRKAEFEDLNRAVQSFSAENQNKYLPGFTEDQMSRLGLTDRNQGVYNVFRGPGGVSTAQDIAERGAIAQGAQDVANEQDVARYQALAKIMGNQLTTPRLTQASQIGDAWRNKEGEAALANRLAAAEQTYQNLAKQNLSLSGYGMGRGDTVYATPEELLAQGRSGIKLRDASSNQVKTYDQLRNGNADERRAFLIHSDPRGPLSAFINQYKNFLNEQNYNRTLGGRRETFLDTEAAAKRAALGVTPGIKPGEVTGTDPSLQYNNLANLIKGS